MLTIAVQAVPPPVVQVAPPSPLQSPLAELSPRFACQGDESREIQLSPTKGQADFIATDLQGSWKFADTAFQQEPMPEWSRVPLAPTTSVSVFVRPDDNGRIEEVGRKLEKSLRY